MHLIRVVGIVVMSLFLLLPAYAQAETDSKFIVINIPSRTLELYQGNELIKEYQVAVGKPSTPTPVGNYNILNKEVNPVWIPPNSPSTVVPSGPNNPLGYRWMEFYPTYGIHGTNAPWSIGHAVSNGCVRMQESAVEELYELVKTGTPVKVTYERLKVSFDKNGQASLRIAPDIYYRQTITIDQVYHILAEYGISGAVSRDFISEAILASDSQGHNFAQVYNIKVNNEVLKSRAIVLEDKVYVPVWAVAGALKQGVIWEDKTRTVHVGAKSAEGMVRGDVIYVAAENLSLLFGGKEIVDQEKKEFYLDAFTVLLKGTALPIDVQRINGVLAVPVLGLAEAVGQKVAWNAVTKAISFQGKSIKAAEFGEQPYIPVADIPKLFKLNVSLNEEGRTVEILEQ